MSFDPELMQDFLTESGELLDQLDQDLVTLESTPSDLELVNRVFRALHTIKGSASFLALTNLVTIAHATESALNAARNKVFVIHRPEMDLLLAAVDVIKQQFANIRAGEDLVSAESNLVSKLAALGEGKSIAAAAPAAAAVSLGAASSSAHAQAGTMADANAPVETPFKLPENKASLVEFLVADVEATLDQLNEQFNRLVNDTQRPAAAANITDLSDSLRKNAEFFEIAQMSKLAGLLGEIGLHGSDFSHDLADRIKPLANEIVSLVREQTKGLAAGKLVQRPVDQLCQQFQSLINGDDLAHAPAPTTPSPAEPHTPTTPQPAEPADHAAGSAASDPAKHADKNKADHADKPAASDQTIRVEVGRLETLLNLVGELVLQKNRISALGRQLTAENLGSQDYRESVLQSTSALDRVTGDLQLAVMKTRMQPLEKLFGKYPRLIRDLARKLNKNINLEIVGGETEVDKSVIEELGDPLVHLMRNSADHGIEMPDVRAAKNKPEMGTIKLIAGHQGSHVEIQIIDDGKGMDPNFIAKKAVEKGVCTEAEVVQMSDRDKLRLIFAAGFSTADKISDVSGRGVGMDVVRTNIEKLKGTIDIESVAGVGTTMRVKIPLTVAIMTAMMVAVGDEIYAIPLSSITEIVKPDQAAISSIRGNKVMRLRDTVLPLLEGSELFNLPESKRKDSPFAVVLQMGDKRMGLMCTRLIGQQEVVIKPLDERTDRGGPISGATVRDDGGVSLIVDITKLFQITTKRGPSSM